jgi:hypothetical protein
MIFSMAILCLKSMGNVTRTLERGSDENYLTPEAFRPHLSMGWALSEQRFWTPNRTEIVLPGAWLAQFEGFLHEQPPT